MRMMKYQANKKKGNNAGFSLLEVILSMAILAIISIPLLMYFTESIRYSALMEEEQQATLLAQEITEDLKVQDNLIAIPVGESAYSVPYLKDAGYTETANLLNADGTGDITLAGTAGNYDVEVKLSTAVAANAVVRPVIYGIDDTTDALAVEHDQKNEALAYFVAINNAYYAANPGYSVLTQSQIISNMTRKITIDIGTSGTEYTVAVSYEYTCMNLRGTGSVDTCTTSKLLDVRMASLKNIYLLYDRNENLGATDWIDVNSTAVFTAGEEPHLYLICQNLKDDSVYTLQVKRINANQIVHTNISYPAEDKNTGAIIQTGRVFKETGDALQAPHLKELTGTGTPVRVITIETKIYKKGHAASDEPYVIMNTTKGE